jgi:WD40-like Beta Propeller Repeat
MLFVKGEYDGARSSVSNSRGDNHHMARHLDRTASSRCLAPGVGLFGLVLSLVGCEPVREDRTIEFSPAAESVGFQHGQQGVFVADKDGGGLKRVFQPGADVLATSTPLWSPKGKQLVFTTANSADGDAATAARTQAQLRRLLPSGAEPDPAGQLFIEVPVVYTCWLRDEASGEPPVKLFDAKCDHVGYVAANLAVRWHPQSDRIIYLNTVSSGRHALFAYDLKTKASQKIFPHEARALVFDWSPDGEHLACVVGTWAAGGNAGSDRDGLWIGQPDADPAAWWHVSSSNISAEAGLGSLLEQLRATRPAWTADGLSFAFVTYRQGSSQSDPGESRLSIGRPAARRIEEVAREGARLHDLHWSPRGEMLGLVRDGIEPSPIAMPTVPSTPSQTATLHIWDRAGGLSEPLNNRPVRGYAGWCAAGDHLAYVVPGDVLGADKPLWSFLLVPDPLARDAVMVAAGNGAGQGTSKPAFSGLRVTFPHWSPSSSDEVLSLWCTFSPSHRSVLSRFLGGGLRSGDPAALLDARTGTLAWMAVSPLEELQIGHYYQIKQAYDEAWRRYERALAATSTASSIPEPEPKSAAEWAVRLFSPRGIAVFQFHCLTKLGRHDYARTWLESFRNTYPPQLPPARANNGTSIADGLEFPLDQPWFRDAMQPGGLCARLLQDLYIAEVFLSLDASGDASEYFGSVTASNSAETDTARLSAAVVLSQILLLQGKHDEYAELCTESLAPLLLKLPRSLPAYTSSTTPDVTRYVPDIVGGLALLPLTSEKFLGGLSNAALKSMTARWAALRSDAKDDFDRLAADLVLEASFRKLGQSLESRQAVERIDHNPALKSAGSSAVANVAGGITDEMVESLRQLVSVTALGAQARGTRP